MNIAVIAVSPQGITIAEQLKAEWQEQLTIFSTHQHSSVESIRNIKEHVDAHFGDYSAWVFIGAMGICIRTIAEHVQHKYHDPAVINIDSTGRFVVSVLSGHVGGANELTEHIASLLGAQAVVSTQTDNTGLWALDLFSRKYGWAQVNNMGGLNKPIALYTNGKPTALLLEVRDKFTLELERTHAEHVDIYYKREDLDESKYELILVVSPRVYETSKPCIQYIPKSLALGLGCRYQCAPKDIPEYICNEIRRLGYYPEAIKRIGTIDLKKDEPLLKEMLQLLKIEEADIYTSEDLAPVEIKNPSDYVFKVTGVYGVAESASRLSARMGSIVIEKQKGMLHDGNDFTFAVSIDRAYERRGHIEIVGAGPGDPDLCSIRGRAFLEIADLILYAGSLVPRALTTCHKPGATVRSSADMNLEEQFALMKEFYDKGLLVVRLHTGDPCIYGAIQEQMAFFDEYDMSYHITPGISSFQAAAAALRSQFTIPEKTQTIILTRGEGRTPMPEKEKLHMLARSQSTMCIFLSAGIVDDVQAQLLEHYPEDTPVAACYHLTWPDERIYRGQLKDLAKLVHDNKLTLTTMLVIGEAIDNRKGLSRLYADEFKHLFRK
ncbi:MAG: precorrin-4 C(11)-methyltransferase [Porphyromonas sp.]|jgi:precorrin-4 C(11)-methyltransferase|nr:precorrin-4 C(11)-methyltransferase [Porphyromonas sp.]